MKPKDAWLATQGQLELQLQQRIYDTWLRDCKFVSYADRVFTISVRNAYIKDWLEKRLYRPIRHTLSDIYREQVDILFVVSNPINDQPDWWEVQSDGLPLQAGTMPNAGMNQPHMPPPPQAPPSYQQQHYHNGFADTQPYMPETQKRWDPHLQPTRSFETFIVGPNNQMAQAAAQAVSRAPGEIYNPLYIFGETGLGKTHLLHAIGNVCHQNNLKVLYTTSEDFTNALVESIRNKSTADFREQFRHVDVLLIDDIQFIAGKESTQEEFFHTFNALHNSGKQVVMAGDRVPSQIRGMEKRLVSRLEWGLQVVIQEPSYETRLAIAQDKSALKGHLLPQAVAELIARQKGNIRMLEGMVTTVIAHSTLMQMPLTQELAQRILLNKSENGGAGRPRDIADTKRRLSLEQVLRGAADVMQLDFKDLVSKSRTHEISQARQWAIYVARQETNASWHEIGNVLGGRNHSTVLYNYNKIADLVKSDPAAHQQLIEIREYLHNTAFS